ncbi:MAG TPA: hypothetical protein VMT19_13110 [Thermoanaerobaculaceae bacterium]|nr:hypothetical protein [Thermoanaerobaculaceae bacterium]
MRRVIFALVFALVAGTLCAQEAPVYARGENPFQGDFPFALGQPINLNVDVEGVRLDAVTVSARGEVRAGEKVRCETLLAGNNTTDKKPTLTMVLLLEDADGKALEKVTFDQFRAKAGKEFQERQRVVITGEALAAAHKVYVFVQIAF